MRSRSIGIASDHGACKRVLQAAQPGPSRRPGAFQGSARTLGGEAAQPEPGAPAAAAGADAAQQQPQAIVHTIAFYSNGIFTVDDGGPGALYHHVLL